MNLGLSNNSYENNKDDDATRLIRREENVRLNFRLVLLVLFGLAVIVVGLFASKPIILASIPIMLLIGFTLLQLRQPKISQVQVTRTLEKLQINEEDTSRVRLEITNKGTSDFPFLQISDWVPKELRGDDTRSTFSITLRSGETRRLLYEIRGNYFGKYLIGPVALSSQDSAGLVENTSKIDLVSRLIIFPKNAGRLSGFTIGPKTTRPRPGEIPSRRIGSGSDFFRIRELLPGEYSKRINWRASARRIDETSLFVNEYTTNQVAETLIVLDCRSDLLSIIKEKEDTITAFSVRAAMSISERLLRDKNRVGLFALGARSESVAPGYGRRQYDRIALTLSSFNPGIKFFGEKVSLWVRQFYPKVSQIVLISPLMSDENLDAAFDLAKSSSGFYDLIIVSPNPLDFPLDKNPKNRLRKTRDGRLAWKLAELERKSVIRQLDGARAIVLDWHVSEPLEQVVSAERQMVAKRIAQLART